ncbi:MAG: hypothetical protein M1812_004494 [Candelaria pacifica]|nr:MAG: hypothetical protein M1812_004494 [Candelaria pacifica]
MSFHLAPPSDRTSFSASDNSSSTLFSRRMGARSKPLIRESAWNDFPVEYRPQQSPSYRPPPEDWRRKASKRFDIPRIEAPKGNKKTIGSFMSMLKRSNSESNGEARTSGRRVERESASRETSRERGPDSARSLSPLPPPPPSATSRLIWVPSEQTWLRIREPELYLDGDNGSTDDDWSRIHRLPADDAHWDHPREAPDQVSSRLMRVPTLPERWLEGEDDAQDANTTTLATRMAASEYDDEDALPPSYIESQWHAASRRARTASQRAAAARAFNRSDSA